MIQAYCDALTARASLTAKDEGMEIAGETLRSAKVREKKGTIARTDTLQATTALAKASLEKNRARGDYEKAVSLLGYILGVPGNPSIVLQEDLDEKAGENGDKALVSWLDEAMKRHPAVLAARSQFEAAQQRVTATRSAGLPYLNLSANYYNNTGPGQAVTPTETAETTMGLMVTIPLFDGFSST